MVRWCVHTQPFRVVMVSDHHIYKSIVRLFDHHGPLFFAKQSEVDIDMVTSRALNAESNPKHEERLKIRATAMVECFVHVCCFGVITDNVDHHIT